MYRFNSHQKEELFKALFYLKMSELRNLCITMGLLSKGEKMNLIERIKHYINTGQELKPQIIPSISKGKSREVYPLKEGTLILYGSFKNDLKTRIFLKSLIGNHFHYTAYGIDWIKERWFAGKPPTYAQFADYWQSEYSARQKVKAPLKPEWAYLNFLEQFKTQNPNASKLDANDAWNALREMQVKKIELLLNVTI